jgi:hypothetical protein
VREDNAALVVVLMVPFSALCSMGLSMKRIFGVVFLVLSLLVGREAPEALGCFPQEPGAVGGEKVAIDPDPQAR